MFMYIYFVTIMSCYCSSPSLLLLNIVAFVIHSFIGTNAVKINHLEQKQHFQDPYYQDREFRRLRHMQRRLHHMHILSSLNIIYIQKSYVVDGVSNLIGGMHNIILFECYLCLSCRCSYLDLCRRCAWFESSFRSSIPANQFTPIEPIVNVSSLLSVCLPHPQSW